MQTDREQTSGLRPLAVVNGLEGPSPIYVGRGLLARVGEVAAASVAGRRAAVVTDSNVTILLFSVILPK